MMRCEGKLSVDINVTIEFKLLSFSFISLLLSYLSNHHDHKFFFFTVEKPKVLIMATSPFHKVTPQNDMIRVIKDIYIKWLQPKETMDFIIWIQLEVKLIWY
jgi:hypothetical protein